MSTVLSAHVIVWYRMLLQTSSLDLIMTTGTFMIDQDFSNYSLSSNCSYAMYSVYVMVWHAMAWLATGHAYAHPRLGLASNCGSSVGCCSSVHTPLRSMDPFNGLARQRLAATGHMHAQQCTVSICGRAREGTACARPGHAQKEMPWGPYICTA